MIEVSWHGRTASYTWPSPGWQSADPWLQRILQAVAAVVERPLYVPDEEVYAFEAASSELPGLVIISAPKERTLRDDVVY